MLKRILLLLDGLLAAAIGGGFGLKDLFTLVNLAGGVVSIWLSFHGRVEAASAAIMIGYLGDGLDGPVARLTGRQNRFGSELDTIADHMAQCVAPAFVAYVAFRQLGELVGLGLAFLVVATGSIRHARSAAEHFAFDLCWNGMPRPVAAFLIVAFVNSHFRSLLPAGDWIGVGVVVAVSVANLLPIPFLSHHGRRLQWWVRTAIVASFALCILLGIFAHRYMWDALFVIIFGYSLTSWVPMSRQERAAYFQAARQWRRRLAGASEEDGEA